MAGTEYDHRAPTTEESSAEKLNNERVNLRTASSVTGSDGIEQHRERFENCGECAFFLKPSVCQIVEGPVANDQVCNWIQGRTGDEDDEDKRKYDVNDVRAFVWGMMKRQPYQHKVVDVEFTPVGWLILIEDTADPPHYFSLSLNFHIEHTSLEHHWCLSGKTGVLTQKGFVPINQLVAEGCREKVMTVLPDGSLALAPIANYSKSPRGNRAMLRVNLRHARRSGRSIRVCAWVTDDHRMLTSRGWVEAGALQDNDLVATGELAPNSMQAALIEGMLLGDASLSRGGRFEFCNVDRKYVELKRTALIDLGPKPYMDNRKSMADCGFNAKPIERVNFPLKIWSRLLRERWYNPQTHHKKVPENIVLADATLAAWYMDDGFLIYTRQPRPEIAAFATGLFTEQDKGRLLDAFEKRGIPGRQEQTRIVLTLAGTAKLMKLIGSFVPPSFRYKLVGDVSVFDPRSWELGKATVGFDNIEVVAVDRRYTKNGRTYTSDKTVFCLDIEGTHNFITRAGVVHNTQEEADSITRTGKEMDFKPPVNYIEAEEQYGRGEIDTDEFEPFKRAREAEESK